MQKRWMTVERLQGIARTAMLNGYGRIQYVREDDERAGGKPRRVVVLDVKHTCEQPYEYELHARWSSRHGKRVKPLIVRGSARCRKCEACMSYRSWQWRTKGLAEFAAHRYTLFGTFTMSPEQHYMLDARIASGANGRPRRDMRDLAAQEVFSLRTQAFGDELQKWLKRVREGRQGEKPQLRYMLIAEMHDGEKTSDEMRGRPHFHIMLHTQTIQTLVRGAIEDKTSEWLVTKAGRILVKDDAWLRQQWTYGFTNFELAKDDRAVWYVCKYISKAMTCRVRASYGYGTYTEGTEVRRANVSEEEPKRARPLEGKSTEPSDVVRETHRTAPERAKRFSG